MAKTWFLASTMNLLHPMFDDNKSSLPFPFNPSNQRIVCILPESIRYGFAGSPQFSNVIREWKSAKRSLMYFDEDFKRFSSFSPLFSLPLQLKFECFCYFSNIDFTYTRLALARTLESFSISHTRCFDLTLSAAVLYTFHLREIPLKTYWTNNIFSHIKLKARENPSSSSSCMESHFLSQLSLVFHSKASNTSAS